MSLASRIVADITQADEITDRLSQVIHEAVAALRAEHAYQLRAQAYDGVRISGTRTVLHEGEVIPVRSDPVGEHVAHADTSVEEKLRRLGVLADQLRSAALAVQGEVTGYVSAAHRMTSSRAQLQREAADVARGSADVERENECCRSCYRLYLREPQGSDPGKRWINTDLFVRSSDVNGKLAIRLPLCEWCWRFIDDTGRMPSTEELVDRQAGRRVRRRVS